MPSHQREVEDKYDVGDVAALPSLADLPDVACVGGPHTLWLEAHYFDTEDLALGRRGITLRRRTGGDDDGWHLKLPVKGARQEIHAPLGRAARVPPIALRRIVQGVVRDSPLGHVATVRTERTTATLMDGDDSVLAEVCDDRVLATRPRPGGDEEHEWREWEVEIHEASPRLTKALRKRMRESGAERAAGPSKFGRLMQLGETSPAGADFDDRATEHELLMRHLTGLVADLHRLDPAARADLPDAVHQLRLVVRRLRSALRSFEVCFDAGVTDPVREELQWIGDVLGRPRDLEVLQDHLSRLVLTVPPPLLRGRPGTWINTRLRSQYRGAHKEVLAAMASDRYFALVDTLDSWRDGPPWSDRADRRADKKLPQVLHREWRRVEKAVKKADAADETARPDLLHRVRKRAKRVRYAAEMLEPVLGREARDAVAAAKKVQRGLGAHHDTLVASQAVLELADAAYTDGRDTFTFGVLRTRLEAEMSQHDRAFRRTWRKLRGARS
jgi:CHAD domain-containing protein